MWSLWVHTALKAHFSLKQSLLMILQASFFSAKALCPCYVPSPGTEMGMGIMLDSVLLV